MPLRRGLAILAAAAIAASLLAAPASAVTVRVRCDSCADWPIWFVALLAVIGILIAMGILYLPRRLVRFGRTPQQRTWILVGGWLLLTVAFVFGARALVVLLGGT